MLGGRTKALFLIALAASSFLLTCSEADDPRSGRLVVIGSESVGRAMDDEAREFMAMYDKAEVRTVPIGSVAGLKAMFEAPPNQKGKDTLLAVSARPLTETERKTAAKLGFAPREYRIAMDGVAIIVNITNPVESLSLAQVRDLFAGRIRNWKEVGGADRAVRVVFGNPNSATYELMRDSVVQNAGLSPGTLHHDSMLAIIRTVREDPGAIGYCGSSYLYQNWLSQPPYPEPGIKGLALARTAAGPYVTPDPGTIYDKSYPLWRYIYLVSRREPKGVAAGFVTFAMSSQGQQALVRDGFAPATVKFIVNREEE